MSFWREDDPTLITSAATSRPEEIRVRERKYVISMTFRAICFILAVVLFHGVLRFVAVAIAVIMPWIAVMFANGGPAPQRGRPSLYTGRAPTTSEERPAIEQGRHIVIDGEVDGGA